MFSKSYFEAATNRKTRMLRVRATNWQFLLENLSAA
jgi:hypothetical protein